MYYDELSDFDLTNNILLYLNSYLHPYLKADDF